MEKNLTPDWILKETLAVHQKSLMDYISTKGGKDDVLALTVLGCGTLGTAILGGILDSLTNPSDSSTSSEEAPARLPSKFNACIRRPESAKRLKSTLDKYNANLHIYENDNLPAVQEAGVVLLGCKPYMVEGLLNDDSMRDALRNKLLISILAGVPETQIQKILYPGEVPADACKIVRAMPNTAAAVRESMTVIATSNPPLPAETNSLITWIFTRIGKVVHLPPAQMDVSTALCGSGPAFVASMIESLAMGAVAMGLPREEAYTMAAQTMRGTTGLVLGGEHPAILRDKVSTPGGCTIGGLLVLEEAGVRGTIAKAVREATVVASQLGQGKQGVNGTRHS